MFTSIIAVATVLASALLGTVAALPKVSVVGSKFFTDDGNQFFLKGIAYQLVPDDPLVDTDQCTRDAKLMKDLGANSIRVYHVDPKKSHDGCMKAFADAGIYLFLDLDTFSTQIEPAHPTWNQTQFDYFTEVLDTFHNYDNLAGVFVGNEVLTTPKDSAASVYVKAAARDIKAYRDSKGYRKIPVGYSAADIAELRPMLQNYLVCGGNASESIDFFGLNAYEWCGTENDFKTSGYVNLQREAAGYPVPIFFSETGCIQPRPRTFADQAAIFGMEMVDTWSGSIVYEWIEETNNYGLISYGPKVDPTITKDAAEGFVRVGTPTPISPDFQNLKSQWATITPVGVKLSDYTAKTSSIKTPACPTSAASGWQINGNPSIPAIGQTFNPSGSQASANPSATAAATATHGSANGGKEITGMTLGLAGVMLGFIVWL